VLHVHRAERADGLVEALAGILADAPADPFAREVVSVPTRGVERWLAQSLSRRLGATPGRGDGVCANVDFAAPRRLLGDAVADAAGIDPDEDPWVPERAVWPLLEIVDASLGEPWCRGLASYLEGEARRSRRFAAVRHLAGLFDRYALYRPELLHAWASGEDDHWQAHLWRRLDDALTVAGPAERMAAACARLREDGEPSDLPPRVSLFGLTRLPAGHLRVLEALAVHREVHLFVLHPSPVLWERLRGAPVVERRRPDPTVEVPRNRLLASWGQDSRELQLVLARAEGAQDHHHAVEHDTATLLRRIQADVRADRFPDAREAPPPLDPADRSLQVHACHGRARQVEVVRDAILHLLDEDDTLEPRDVIVMCPDIETFAPLIQATFGAGEVSADGEDELDALPADVRPPDLRVRLADRSLRQTNPVLGVVSRVLELATERVTASQVLDLADREPVRRRFRLDDEDLTRIEDWVADSGIRWGLDAEHRRPFKLDALHANTWRAGLDRVLVGVTMTEDEQRLFADTLPVDDVDSRAIDLAGRFAELVDRLRHAIDAFATPKPMEGWAAAIAEAADALTLTTARDGWQRAQLQRILDDVARESGRAATELTLGEVRALLADRLQGRPTRANFRTGSLTICTLVPMRSVPHRVVCLLGLDDGVFPRKAPRDGDDLLLAEPHVGERDARAEDRQLLLDALLAARDQLIVTYTGNDERTNIEKPPAVPVGELLDVVDRMVRVEEGRAREAVHTRHPLQPFDPRNFTEGEMLPARAWSFDRVTLEGARALVPDRPQPPPFLAGPLDAPQSDLIEVEDLVRFVEHPARAFLRKRLGISVAEYEEEVEDGLPVELDGLDRWAVGQRMLDARLAGADVKSSYRAEIARGALPPGRLGQPVIQELVPVVESIVAAAADVASGDAESADVALELDGRTLSGTVGGLHGDVLRRVIFSRVGPKHRLAAWVRALALNACGHRVQAVTVGRGVGGHDVSIAVVRVPPVAAEEARRLLGDLVALYDRGMRHPLPLACQTSAAFAANGEAAARRAWTSEWGFDKEDRELDHRLVFGGVLTFDELMAMEGFAEDAHALWDELLEVERQ
jgi:exodeoxyribonuclease V gamma subunit